MDILLIEYMYYAKILLKVNERRSWKEEMPKKV